MATDLLIRPAEPDDDVESVFDLLWQLAPGDERPAREQLAAAWSALHAQPGRQLLLAHAGPALVGTPALVGAPTLVGTVDTLVVPNLTHGARPYMLIENVVVDAEARRRGVASALLRAAEDRARTTGCYKIQLVSNEARTEAHHFYESAGFVCSAKGYRRYLPQSA